MSEISSNIVKSFTYLSILIELSKGRKLTGYGLMVHLKNIFGFEVSPGTIYHQLGMLSKNGIIKGEKHSSKTVYEMTGKGIEVFKEFKKKWEKPLDYAYQNLLNRLPSSQRHNTPRPRGRSTPRPENI